MGSDSSQIPKWEDPNPFRDAEKYSFASSEAKGVGQYLFLFSGHTMGEIDICGCALNPKGGLERRLNYVRSVRAEKAIPVNFFDAGNALFATEQIPKSQLTNAKERAKLILKAYKDMQIKALNVGFLDLSLGIDFLKKEAQAVGVGLISTNLVDQSGKPIFNETLNFKIDSQNFVVMGLSAGTSNTEKLGVKALDPVSTILDRLKNLPKDNLVLVLSDAGQMVDSELATKADRALIIVGSREPYSLEIPLHIGKSIVLRPHFQGQQWTQFEFQWKPEPLGWYNFYLANNFSILWESRQKAYNELKASKGSQKEIDEEMRVIENSRREMGPFMPIQLSKKVFYQMNNNNLSEDFAKPNEYTNPVRKLVNSQPKASK